MKHNELFVPECPIKISKEPDVIEIEDVDNALPFSRLTYNIKPGENRPFRPQ